LWTLGHISLLKTVRRRQIQNRDLHIRRSDYLRRRSLGPRLEIVSGLWCSDFEASRIILFSTLSTARAVFRMCRGWDRWTALRVGMLLCRRSVPERCTARCQGAPKIRNRFLGRDCTSARTGIDGNFAPTRASKYKRFEPFSLYLQSHVSKATELATRETMKKGRQKDVQLAAVEGTP
jgi:hypothetical protein